MTQTYTDKGLNNVDINTTVSNFDIRAMRQRNVSFDVLREKYGWLPAEVTKRIIAARSGIEWQYGEGPNGIKEAEERETRRFEAIKDEYSKVRSELMLKKTVRMIREIKKRMKASEFKNLFSLKKSNAHVTHAIGIDKGMEYLERYNISGKRSNTSGIDISLDNGNTIAIRASGDEPGSVFLIQGELTNLISSHIMIVRNMNDEKRSFYILDKATAIDLSSESYYTEDGTGSWFIYPKEYMIFENNIEGIKG